MENPSPTNVHSLRAYFCLACSAIVAFALTSCTTPEHQSCCGTLPPANSNPAAPNQTTTTGNERPPQTPATPSKKPEKKPGQTTKPIANLAGSPSTCPDPMPKAKAPTGQNPLPVNAFQREGLNTCWAACGEIIMDYIGGVRVRQCCQANRRFNQYGCCLSDNTVVLGSPCSNDGYPDFGYWHFTGGQASAQVLSWSQIRNEIAAGCPFTFSWQRKQTITSQHMMVVHGFYDDNGDQWLEVTDPAGFQVPAQRWQVPYGDYLGQGSYQTVLTFSGIRAP
jgi:hypothetical protein